MSAQFPCHSIFWVSRDTSHTRQTFVDPRRYFASQSYKTKSLEHAVLHSNPPITPDRTVATVPSFNLHQHYSRLMREAPAGCKNLFMSEFQVFFVWGETAVDIPVVKTAEVFAWQHQGSSTLDSKSAGTRTELPAGHVHLLRPHETADGLVRIKVRAHTHVAPAELPVGGVAEPARICLG